MYDLLRVGGLLFGTNTDIVVERRDSPPKLLSDVLYQGAEGTRSKFDAVDSKLFFMLRNVEET